MNDFFDIEDDPAAIARANAQPDSEGSVPPPEWYCEYHDDNAPHDSRRCHTAQTFKNAKLVCHPATNVG